MKIYVNQMSISDGCIGDLAADMDRMGIYGVGTLISSFAVGK